MIIRSSDVHIDFDRARIGFTLAAEKWSVVCDTRLMSQWRVMIPDHLRKTFLELARDFAKQGENCQLLTVEGRVEIYCEKCSSSLGEYTRMPGCSVATFRVPPCKTCLENAYDEGGREGYDFGSDPPY
jgi:hypothetical protein